jgi:hypothetical protein
MKKRDTTVLTTAKLSRSAREEPQGPFLSMQESHHPPGAEYAREENQGGGRTRTHSGLREPIQIRKLQTSLGNSLCL